MTRELNDGPVWLPGLHGELSIYAERRRVPRDECPGIADEALGITLAKRRDDPCLYAAKPSEAFRQLSFRIARNLAVDFRRQAAREEPFGVKPDTSDEDRDTSTDVPADTPPIGRELEVNDEVDHLLSTLDATAEKLCGGMKDPYRQRYARGVIDAYIKLSVTGDSPPSGRSLGKLMTEHGLQQRDGRPFPEQTACDVLWDFFDLLDRSNPEDA